MRASQRLALSVIVIAVAAFLDGGSVTARAMGELPEWQARDAAELHSAPWLICTFGADTAGGIPDSMSWQWRSRKFEHGVDIKKAVSAIIFDDQKRRAGIFNVTRNEDGAVLVEQTVESKEARVRVLQDKLLTVIQVDSHSLAGSLTVGTLAIAYPRTVDGRGWHLQFAVLGLQCSEDEPVGLF